MHRQCRHHELKTAFPGSFFQFPGRFSDSTSSRPACLLTLFAQWLFGGTLCDHSDLFVQGSNLTSLLFAIKLYNSKPPENIFTFRSVYLQTVLLSRKKHHISCFYAALTSISCYLLFPLIFSKNAFPYTPAPFPVRQSRQYAYSLPVTYAFSSSLIY